MRAREHIENTLLHQRGQLFCWVPVCLGIGIGGYFGLAQEPDMIVLAGLVIGCLCLAGLSRLVPVAFAPIVVAIMLILAGAGIAKLRAATLAGPVLEFRYYGPIEGRIVNIDRSSSDAVRLTLDRVKLSRMSPDRTPLHVRISIHGDDQPIQFFAGDRVMTTGHLSPPSGPAEPAGFDFQRHAWFMQIGAIGYTRNPVLRSAVAQGDRVHHWVFAQRMALSRMVRNTLDGQEGAFAAAVMTGDRSALSQQTISTLRATNLAHLLAISGLHMGLLTGFVFALIRTAFALLPFVALRIPTKKVAAVGALIAGGGYLMLSGGNVATERAFIMVAVMLVAVLLDRRALTLRAVAMAATLVLITQPEALIGPGFQMSFAATTGLVAAFQALRRFDFQRLPKWLRPVLSVVLSSAIAGAATAPFAAAHFNQIAHYGLLANVLSVPFMGLVVVPAAVMAVCLAPFGLWGVGLEIAAAGLRWILFVADQVAGIEGGVGHIIAPDPAVLPLLALGALWCILWKGRLCTLAIIPIMASVVMWSQTTRHHILVADNGGLIGVMGDQGRALSRDRGNGFVASIWLENDGAPVDQAIAADRRGFARVGRRITVNIGPWRILQVTGKVALSEVTNCDGYDILISNQIDNTPRDCTVFDITRLRETGSLGIDLVGDNLVITPARYISGRRLWNAGADVAPIVITP